MICSKDPVRVICESRRLAKPGSESELLVEKGRAKEEELEQEATI